MKSKRDREEPCYVCGHYHNYDAGEPCSICGHVLSAQESKTQDSVLPTQIVSPFLYLGNYDTASRSELLKQMSITHILNTVPNCPVLFRNTFIYHTASNSPPDFEECMQFLETVRNTEGARVLVYCMSGLSRSPTVVIAYLMKLRGWRLAECYKWVKSRRKSVVITPADTARLTQLEIQLHGHTSVPNGFEAIPVTDLDASARQPLPTPPIAQFPAPPPAWSFPCPQVTPTPVSPPAFSFAAPTSSAPFVFRAAPTAQPAAQSSSDMEL